MQFSAEQRANTQRRRHILDTGPFPYRSRSESAFPILAERNLSDISDGKIGGRRPNPMIERDKPLSFYWRAVDETWIDDLRLPTARSRKHESARSAILVDAALTGIAEPDGWIS